MKRLITRWSLSTSDRLRFNPVVRWVVARSKLLQDALSRSSDTRSAVRSIDRLCAAARLAPDDRTLRTVEARLHHRGAAVNLPDVDWADHVPSIDQPHVSKAVILKPYVSDREKGVVFISFEYQWAKLLRHTNLERFAKRYTLVVSPTWCPPHSVVNALFPRAYPEPFFSLISNVRDMELFPRISPKYRMVPLFASSWVNPGFYQPVPRDRRDIDLVMIANMGKYKRHHALFKALRQMPGHVRATLIGQSQGKRTADTIRREAWAFGVEDRVTVLSHVSNEVLADCLRRAKVSVILSRREGSCVAVVESMFADTPVVLLDGAEVGSGAFINPATGCFVPERRLAAGLMDVLGRHQEFSPRRWAEANVSCFRSSAILNEHLRAAAIADGKEWTRDIAALCWRPDPQLVEPEQAPWLAAEREWARTHLGVEIGDAPPAAVSPARESAPGHDHGAEVCTPAPRL